MWRIAGVQGIYSGRFFDLNKDNITIGKSDNCGVSLADDQSIAESQAEFLLCNGSYVFKDLDNACPTMVNGTVPEAMMTLSNGDLIQIGESVFRVEQVEVPARSMKCAFPKAETAKRAESSVNITHWKLPTAALLVTLLILAIAIPNIRRVNECRARHAECMRMAQEVIASLQSIESALKVGVSQDEYGKKVIDAQTKVDAYIAKFGKGEFNGLTKKLMKAQQAYVDAGDLWDYKIHFERGDYFDHGDPFFRSLPNENERMQAGKRLLELVSRYNDIGKGMNDGGAMIKSTYVTGGTYPSYHTDAAMQIIWELASEELSKLKLPESM